MFKAKKATSKTTGKLNPGVKKLTLKKSTKTGIVGTPTGQKMLQKVMKTAKKSRVKKVSTGKK